jgi:hypothetical protein
MVGVETKIKHHQNRLTKLYNFAIKKKDMGQCLSFQHFDFDILYIECLKFEYFHRCEK